jgi:SAM-dependent methyltransferase
MQTALLDTVYDQMAHSSAEPGPVGDALDGLVAGLRRLYDEMPPSEWQSYVTAARRHPLVHLIHQDPFTCRSFYKPRGYAGDARLLDYIYGYNEDDEHVTALGRSLLARGVQSQASRAVRRRRDILAEYIVRIRQQRPNARVLSVACGHLREAHLAIEDQPVGHFVAVDQDRHSIDTTKGLFGRKGVVALEWRVRDLIAGRRRDQLGSFDLIYAAGLYDYLSDEVARKLTREMFDMVTPGGTLLIANFVPSLRDVGYMEAFMDWHLTYRTPAQMPECGAEVDARQIASQRVFTEDNDAIAFLELVKSSDS